jgi:hypothetical protein
MLPTANIFADVFGTYVLIACILMACGVWDKVWPPEDPRWPYLPWYWKFLFYFLCAIFLTASTILTSFFIG